MFDSARQRYYIAAMEKLYNYAGQIIEDRMEFRQYLCERKEEIMEQLYSLMEDIITQLLKVYFSISSGSELFVKIKKEQKCSII